MQMEPSSTTVVETIKAFFGN